MPIYRDLEELEEKLNDLKNTFVLFVFGRIKADQFQLCMEWAKDFMDGREEQAEEKLSRLLNITERPLSQ